MKIRHINNWILSIAFLLLLIGCDNASEPIQIQKPIVYSDQYYEQLRAYKASDHQIAFMWFSDYSAKHSPGVRFMGLPDSLDICSLWGGIPTDVQSKTNSYNPVVFYDPIVYNEMRFVQKVKGTKMVFVLFPAVGLFAKERGLIPSDSNRDLVIQTYGDYLISLMDDHGLDGMDLDYEIDGDWMNGPNFDRLIEYLGQRIGPLSPRPDKLLIVDGGTSVSTSKYLNYYVNQAYASYGPFDLQNRLEGLSSGGLTPKQYVVTENMGDYYATGGVPFYWDESNSIKSVLGGQLYSLEGMARWNPVINGKKVRKGGFGAFIGQRDYNNNPPYKYLRLGIQLQNRPFEEGN